MTQKSTSTEPKDVSLAVNGTLMRGLELNPNLLNAGGTFIRETTTEPVYRLWSIHGRHPAMIRGTSGGAAVTVEECTLPYAGSAPILLQQPSGLSIGKVKLADGTEKLGVLRQR